MPLPPILARDRMGIGAVARIHATEQLSVPGNLYISGIDHNIMIFISSRNNGEGWEDNGVLRRPYAPNPPTV